MRIKVREIHLTNKNKDALMNVRNIRFDAFDIFTDSREMYEYDEMGKLALGADGRMMPSTISYMLYFVGESSRFCALRCDTEREAIEWMDAIQTAATNGIDHIDISNVEAQNNFKEIINGKR